MEWLLVLLVIPVGLYLVHERGKGRAWGMVPAGEETRGAGAYRTAQVRTWKRGAAPWTVRIAALSSFFLGQMILPGAFAALVGLLITAGAIARGSVPPLLIITLLSAPTGLVVAAHLLAAGSAMLARHADAAEKARRAARWALGHNLVLLPALGLGALLEPREAGWGIASAIYCLVSIGQAVIVLRAAAAIEAYETRQDEDPAPEEVVTTAMPAQ